MEQMISLVDRTFFTYPFVGVYFSLLKTTKCSSIKNMRRKEISCSKKIVEGTTRFPSQLHMQ